VQDRLRFESKLGETKKGSMSGGKCPDKFNK